MSDELETPLKKYHVGISTSVFGHPPNKQIKKYFMDTLKYFI